VCNVIHSREPNCISSLSTCTIKDRLTYFQTNYQLPKASSRSYEQSHERKIIWLNEKKKETWSEEKAKKSLKDWARDEQGTKEAYKKARYKMKETIRIKLHLCWCGSQVEMRNSEKTY